MHPFVSKEYILSEPRRPCTTSFASWSLLSYGQIPWNASYALLSCTCLLHVLQTTNMCKIESSYWGSLQSLRQRNLIAANAQPNMQCATSVRERFIQKWNDPSRCKLSTNQDSNFTLGWELYSVEGSSKVHEDVSNVAMKVHVWRWDYEA